jgi:hypothetical protein
VTDHGAEDTERGDGKSVGSDDGGESSSAQVIFKPHARRHAPAAGLSAEAIEAGIAADLASNPPQPGTPFHRVISVGGKAVKYTGIKRLDTGVVEVGTYYWWTRRGRG